MGGGGSLARGKNAYTIYEQNMYFLQPIITTAHLYDYGEPVENLNYCIFVNAT
jgi:hypothetical protein